VARQLEPLFSTRVTALRYQGLDALSHIHWLNAEPGRFNLLTPAGAAGAAALDAYYKEIDSDIGRIIDSQAPGDLLLVISGFGMERVSLAKRIVARLMRQDDRTGSHEGAPDGFMLAYGQQVVHSELPRGAIVDVAPTVLYYLGLPVGRDMDGFARSDIFVRAYRRDHPVTYISTHEK
jgi:predicted AlkP superfamily phosphohydrolase/phosphomutase